MVGPTLLPSSVLLSISGYLRLNAIVSFQLTCKFLYEALSDSKIWSRALIEMSRLTPLSHLLPDLSSLTVPDSRMRVLDTVRLDCLWYHDRVNPTLLVDHSTDAYNELQHRFFPLSPGDGYSACIETQLLPGGAGLAVMFEDGTVVVHDVQGFSQQSPPLILPRMGSNSAMKVSLSSRGEALVSIYSQIIDWAHVSLLRVYHVELSTESFHCLKTISTSVHVDHFASEGDFLLYGGSVAQGKVLYIHDLSPNSKRELCLTRRDSDTNLITVSAISSRTLLLSSSNALELYNIPKWSSKNTSHIQPFWTFNLPTHAHLSASTPIIGPIVWDSPGGRHIGVVPILSGDLLLLLKPSDTADKCRVVIRFSPSLVPSQARCTVGSRRVLWVSTRAPKPAKRGASNLGPHIELQIATFLRVSKGREGGIVRVESVPNKPNAEDAEVDMRTVTLRLPLEQTDVLGAVDHISWDEESCRICVFRELPATGGGRQRHTFFMVFKI